MSIEVEKMSRLAAVRESVRSNYMGRRDGMMRLLRLKIQNIEKEIPNKEQSLKMSAGRALDMLRLIEDYDKDRERPPINVWSSLKRIVRIAESMVCAFDTDSDVPSRFVEEMRESLKDLVDCEIGRVV